LFESVAIKHVVRVEGDESLSVGVGDVDAGLLDGAQVECLGVDELDDENAKEIVVAEVLRSEYLGEAAEELTKSTGL
jgi:Glu-tRNA(Gln) amidotransferase subunit E-like FAD-binding protein